MKSMKCSVYKLGKLKSYKFAVTFARYQNKWVVCKHKGRDTWETSGGHIESGESPMEAAKRELFEETGAVDFDITPVCDYWACDEPHETDNISWSNGQVFLAHVKKIGKLPDNEMECIDYFEEFPEKLTYPDITRKLLPHVFAILNKNYCLTTDLKISELISLQNALQNRMKGKWLSIIPENGHFSLLWMFEEMGELVAIIKKRGGNAIMEDKIVRDAFIEELSDTLMYFIDLMTCYGVSAKELSLAFLGKHEKNMSRDFVTEHKKYLSGDELPYPH